MLFLTVYGPELESLFYYIHKYTQREGSINSEQLYSAYVPQATLTHKGQTKNIYDAVKYLKAARLIEGDYVYNSVRLNLDMSMPFAALLLRQFRQLELISSQLPPIDLLYMTLLEHLYITPNLVWIS